MSPFDIGLLVLVGGFVIYGLFSGLIRMVGSLVASIASIFVASHYYLSFYENVGWLHFQQANAGKITAFIILMVLVSVVVRVAFFVIQKIFDIVSIIPFVKSINGLAGAIMGLLEGSITVGIILFMASRYAVVGHFFGDAIAASKIAPIFLAITNIVYPLLPQGLKLLQSII
jgi:uncharacterized membrane protein required for colicin V production